MANGDFKRSLHYEHDEDDEDDERRFADIPSRLTNAPEVVPQDPFQISGQVGLCIKPGLEDSARDSQPAAEDQGEEFGNNVPEKPVVRFFPGGRTFLPEPSPHAEEIKSVILAPHDNGFCVFTYLLRKPIPGEISIDASIAEAASQRALQTLPVHFPDKVRGIVGDMYWEKLGSRQEDRGTWLVSFRQIHKGKPVHGAQATVIVAAEGEIRNIYCVFANPNELPDESILNTKAVYSRLADIMGTDGRELTLELNYYYDMSDCARRSWRIVCFARGICVGSDVSGFVPGVADLILDPETGEVLVALPRSRF